MTQRGRVLGLTQTYWIRTAGVTLSNVYFSERSQWFLWMLKYGDLCFGESVHYPHSAEEKNEYVLTG